MIFGKFDFWSLMAISEGGRLKKGGITRVHTVSKFMLKMKNDNTVRKTNWRKQILKIVKKNIVYDIWQNIYHILYMLIQHVIKI